jgi:hypothetical protein
VICTNLHLVLDLFFILWLRGKHDQCRFLSFLSTTIFYFKSHRTSRVVFRDDVYSLVRVRSSLPMREGYLPPYRVIDNGLFLENNKYVYVLGVCFSPLCNHRSINIVEYDKCSSQRCSRCFSSSMSILCHFVNILSHSQKYKTTSFRPFVQLEAMKHLNLMLSIHYQCLTTH